MLGIVGDDPKLSRHNCILVQNVGDNRTHNHLVKCLIFLIDEKHQIIASDLTEKSAGDTNALNLLLDQVDAFDIFLADGAYDGDPFYTQILQRQPNANIVIPPPKNAVPNASAQPMRNQHVDAINNQGRMA